MRRASRRDGFTLLEVMMTLAIMLVAVMGIVSLQRAAIRSNLDSRAISTAATNNARWASIVRRSALSWTTTSTTGIPYVGITRNAWTIPSGADPYGVDWYGAATTTATNMRFCTLIRVRDISAGNSIRVDIVTFWASMGQQASSGGTAFQTLCVANGGATAGAALFGTPPTTGLRHVRSSIVVRKART